MADPTVVPPPASLQLAAVTNVNFKLISLLTHTTRSALLTAMFTVLTIFTGGAAFPARAGCVFAAALLCYLFGFGLIIFAGRCHQHQGNYNW